MSPRLPTTDPTPHPHPAMAARGSEVHPSWVSVRVNKASVSPPGAALVGSDIRHQHVVVLTVSEMSRSRELHSTWWHEEKEIIKVAMSEAQFAAVITSFGDGSAKPATLWRHDGELIPQVRDDPGSKEIRQAVAETESSAEDAVAHLAEKVAELNALIESGAGKRQIREAATGLTHHVNNLPQNLSFAATQLQRTVETVVTKARYDIEAIVESRARALGIEPGQVVLELGVGADEETSS